MERKILQKFSCKVIAAFIAFALLATGVCYIKNEGNVVRAATPENAVTVNSKGYYVKEFTGKEFNTYKNDNTYPNYPKLVTNKEDDDVQEWLFAGWYQEKDTENGTCTNVYDSAITTVAENAIVYAKFVPASVMAVKCQVTPGTDVDSKKANMRLISTTDCADYTSMGFNVVYKGKTIPCNTTTLYKRVAASDDGMECNYSANAFDNASNYFFAVRLTNISNANFAEPFYIEPYWVTADGTTVTGVSRYARVEDSYEKIVNLPVRLYSDEKVTSGEVSLSYDATRFDLYAVDGDTKISGTVFDTVNYERTLNEETNIATLKLTGSNAEVDEVVPTVDADGIFANIRLQLKEDQLIESNTSFAVTNESFSNGESSVTLDVANVIYKNYAMNYAGTPDTSWYVEFKDDNTFVISTAADLYGLAAIVNDTTGAYDNERFSGDKIILGADMVINSATLEPDAENWATVSAACAQWTPIGTTNAFAGTFDGQGHTISGVYLTDTDESKIYGLFGTTADGSTLQDFRLENSYFELLNVTTKTPLGSVVGNFNGTLKEIFSDAVVVSTCGKLGGLVGNVELETETATCQIEDCWYNGSVALNREGNSANYDSTGGFVGYVVTGILNVKGCLNTGSVIANYEGTNGSANEGVGGIVGCTATTGSVTMSNVVMAGGLLGQYVEDGSCKAMQGSVSGTTGRGIDIYVGYGKNNVTITNSCYLSNENLYGDSRGVTSNSSNYKNTMTADELNGHKAYDNLKTIIDYSSGDWVVRTTATDLADGVPVPKCFANNDAIDVKWYYDNYETATNEETSEEYKKYTIATAEELYGFADVSASYNFSGDEVYLGADIVANTGNASTWSATTKAVRNWTPIGTVDNPFAGTFDGDGHTISGVYLLGSDKSKTYGLFGMTALESTLRDIRLENSHFELVNITAKTPMGSVAGVLNGDLENVYSNAKVISVRGEIGGLAGSVNQALSGDTNHITNCWHDGKIELNKNAVVGNYECVGGILGLVNAGNLQITSCLKTGEIECTFEPTTSGTSNKAIGGLVGQAKGSLTITDTVMSASIVGQHKNGDEYTKWTGSEDNLSGKGISLSVGYGSATLIDVYCRNSNNYAIYRTAAAGSSNYNNRLTQAKLNGHVAYTNTCTYDSETDTHQGINYYHPDNNPTGVWVIREQADNVADGCPIPKVFADEWVDVAWYYDNVTAATDEVPSPADAYTISTPEEMYGLSVISTFDTFENDTISLLNDIEMNIGLATEWKSGQIVDVRTWTPIGTNDYEFSGIFDGGIHTISGVYIDTEQQGAGLFRTTAQGSKIQNLRLVNSYINSEYSSTYGCVGSLVGSCAGSLENIYSDAYVVSKSSASGGLVGELWSDEDVSVKQCWFDGEMNVVANSGGLIGMYSVTGCTLTMENCLNSGTISYNNKNYIGGLIGRTLPSTSRWCADTNGAKSFITMENCLNYGELSPSPNDKSAAGSVLGQLENCELTLTSVYATNESYIDSTTSTSEYLGNNKKCVLNGEATLDAKNNFEGLEVTSDIFAPLGTGAWVPTLEMPVPAVFADYVAAIDVAWYEKGVGGTINTRAQLWGLSYLSQKQSIDGTITLGADIDLNPGWTASEISDSPTITWSSIGTKTYPFAGTFDGDGHTISGVYLNATNGQYQGLFGYTAAGSEITDFRLENSYIYNSLNYTGSIVGYLKGNLSKVYSNAIVTSGASRLGGLVAYAEPISATDGQIQITDCWFDGKIIGSNGGQYLGGLVSTIRGGTCNMENILFTGQIESDYNGSGYAYIGGIVADVGYDTNNTILNLESVVSAGSIISHWKPNYVHAVVGNARKYGDNTEPQLVMTNVFATRDCYETPYGGNAEKSGVVARTTGADRLIGISSYEDENPDGETTCHLDFSEWSMRVDDVPIPTCFSNLSKVKDTVIAGFEPESLAKEIGLDYWDSDAKITDATFYGAGNYVIPYVATEEQYNEYISILATEEGTETESGYAGLGFTECITNAGTDMAADGVYAQTYCKEATAESGEWVLNLTYVKNLSKIYISVNTDVESITPTLEADNDLAVPDETGDEAISLSMLEIMANSDGESNGNSFVFQLPNKHFIVIDGGREADGTKLVEYLRGQVGEGQDVVIDAWFITHYHADHSGALKAFYKDSSLRENVYLEAIYACEPSSYALDWKEDDQQLTGTNEALRGAKILTKKSDGTKPDVYQLHMGQRYYFYGMTMDVIDTQEQRHVSTWGTQAPDDFNASSTNCVFTFKDKNSDIKKVLIGGDATNTNMQYIVQAFGENNATLSDIDAFVAYHHGLNTTIDYIGHPNLGTANYTWSNFLLENNNNKFEVVFFPYYKIYQNGDEDLPSSVYPDNIGDINTYLCNHADAYYTYGYGDCLEEYNKENRHGTVKITFDGNNTATVYQSGLFTNTTE